MNHRMIKRMLIASLICITVYFFIMPIYVHRASMKFADDIAILFQNRDIEKWDVYYYPDSIINIEGTQLKYSECRNNISGYTGSTDIVPQASYGHYGIKFFESPVETKKMYFHISGGEFEVDFHMRFGIFFKVEEIKFENDPNGFYKRFFTGTLE